MNFKLFILYGFITLISGCVSASKDSSDPGPGLSVLPTRLMGRPISALVERYGPQSEQRDTGNGAEHIWRFETQRLLPGRPAPPVVAPSRTGGAVVVPGRRAMPHVKHESCVLYVTTDTDGIATTWEADGNACVQALKAASRQ